MRLIAVVLLIFANSSLWSSTAFASKVLKCAGEAKVIAIDKTSTSPVTGIIRVIKLASEGPCDLKTDSKVSGAFKLSREKSAIKIGEETHFQYEMVCGPKIGCDTPIIYLH